MNIGMLYLESLSNIKIAINTVQKAIENLTSMQKRTNGYKQNSSSAEIALSVNFSVQKNIVTMRNNDNTSRKP